jgi:hypothetical protein
MERDATMKGDSSSERTMQQQDEQEGWEDILETQRVSRPLGSVPVSPESGVRMDGPTLALEHYRSSDWRAKPKSNRSTTKRLLLTVPWQTI